MENPKNVEDTKSSGSDVSEKSKQSNLTKEEPSPISQDIKPIVTEKPSATNKASNDSKIIQQLSDDLESNHQKFLHDTMKLIEHVALEAEMFRQQIEDFSGTTTDDKDYVYLEEMLIRATVALDAIDTRGNPVLRQERKRAVQYVQKLMRVLDARLKENRRNVRYYRNRDCSDDSDDNVYY